MVRRGLVQKNDRPVLSSWEQNAHQRQLLYRCMPPYGKLAWWGSLNHYPHRGMNARLQDWASSLPGHQWQGCWAICLPLWCVCPYSWSHLESDQGNGLSRKSSCTHGSRWGTNKQSQARCMSGGEKHYAMHCRIGIMRFIFSFRSPSSIYIKLSCHKCFWAPPWRCDQIWSH